MQASGAAQSADYGICAANGAEQEYAIQKTRTIAIGPLPARRKEIDFACFSDAPEWASAAHQGCETAN